jgi:hypothetical protein
MAASPPRTGAERRRRARRGSVERPVNGRIYRAAWALVALPLLIAAFTIARPAALPAPALPPSFDGPTAAQVAEDFADDCPDRTPGTDGATCATAWVRDRLDDYELVVEEHPFEADVPGRGSVPFVNLVARPAGTAETRDAIVVMAHRDNLGLSAGRDDNASGTAALIELARNLSTVSLAHAIVFVSTDGGAYGNVGAAQLAADAGFTERVLAVVDLDSLGGPGPPRLAFAGDRPRSPSGELVATAAASVLAQRGSGPTYATALDQILDLAFPFSFYGQSPFLARNVSALTLTSAGDRPPKPAQDTAATFRPEQLGELGAAAQRLIGSLDSAAEIASGTDSYVYLGGRLVRGFTIQLLLVIALLPPLLATLDLAARVHRRGGELGPATRAYLWRLLAWAFAGGIAALFSLVGLFPNGVARPLSPDEGPGVDWPIVALLGFAAISGLAWLAIRPKLLPAAPAERAEELAGHLVVMLVLCAIGVALAIANPYSLLFVLPALHAWLWIPHVRDAHPAWRAVVLLVGFAGPILLVVSFAVRFRLGFDALWYVPALFSVGYAPLALFVALMPFGAAAGQAGAILFGRYAACPPGLGEGEEADLVAGRQLTGAPGNEHERVGLSGRDDHV